MSGGTVLWLLLLVGLGILFLLTLRRMSGMIARTRELERFQAAAGGLDRRFGAAADPLVARLDEIRRRAGDPQGLVTSLPPAADALRAAAAEARTLRPPAALADRGAGLSRELDRAVRAVELVEHGLDALLAARGNRELEAQVSLKRGALNLRHAREAFRLIVGEVAEVRPADLTAIAAGRSTALLPNLPTYVVDGIDGDVEGPFEPRM